MKYQVFCFRAAILPDGKEQRTPVGRASRGWMPFLRNVTKIIYIVNSCAKLAIIRITNLHNPQEV